MHSNSSVPFKITNISHGFQEANGLFTLEEEGLQLEFEVKDTIVGAVKSEVKTVQIPYSSLESITFKKGLLSAKIILEGVSMNVFSKLPGVEVATCTLKVKRKDRKEAEALASQAKLGLSEYRLSEMEE